MTDARKLYFAFAVQADGRGVVVRCGDLTTAARERDRLRWRLPAVLGFTKLPATEAVARAWLGALGARAVEARDSAPAPAYN